VSDFSHNELEFKHMDEFTVEYESFFVDAEPGYDVFDFDTYFMVFIAEITSTCDTFGVSLDLKPLADSLKYAFLSPNESLPVIIASDLDQDQKENLLDLLRKNKEALGWTSGDIKGISPTVVQHMIHLEDSVRPYWD